MRGPMRRDGARRPIRSADRLLNVARAAAAERVASARAHTATITALAAEITPANRANLLDQVYRTRLAAVMARIGHVTGDRCARRAARDPAGGTAMSASLAADDPTLAGPPHEDTQAGLVGRGERLGLGLRIGVALAAGCLLGVSVGWRLLLPEDGPLADLVAGAAALLVAIPVLAAAWDSLRHPSLHGITDRLIALAMIAAWASGDLLTAAVLPIVMIAGHVLEERSLLGSQEAIRALSRLTETRARRLGPGGAVEVVSAARLRVGDVVEVRAGDRVARRRYGATRCGQPRSRVPHRRERPG